MSNESHDISLKQAVVSNDAGALKDGFALPKAEVKTKNSSSVASQTELCGKNVI